MKRWQIICASLLALLIMVVTPLSIMAANNNNAVNVAAGTRL